jgi:iduronate 2-sulfatase
MKRFLLSIVVGLPIVGGWYCATSAVAVDAAKLNVLFIAVDDLGSVLQSTVQPQAITPNLDRLAASGMRFDHAYCQIPLCNPSRASVLTGARPDACGVFDLSRHFRESMPKIVTLPQHFKEHGWYSARVGKIYHYDVPKAIGTDGLDDHASWHNVINPRGRDVADEADIINPTPEKPISAALSWLAAAGSDEEQTDGMIASETIRLLEQHRDKPFFIAAGFFRPHTPFVAPRKYFDLYPLEQIELPKSPAADRADIPSAAFAHNNQEPHYGLSEHTCREALRGYLASVSFVDSQIGRLLDALDRLGLASSTTVVLWSDHGYHLGEHAGIWQKRTLFEESAKSPLILRWPASTAKGLVCNRVVELVDIYPTLSDLAGLPSPQHLAGRSLRPLLNNPSLEWSHSACTQILRPGNGTPIMGRSIRTQRWRYTEWDEGRAGNELYDHESDPREFVNRINEQEHKSLLEDLQIRLQRNASGMVPRTPFDPSRL